MSDLAPSLHPHTTREFFAAVQGGDGTLRDDPARARELVDEFITPHVDLKGFSKLALVKVLKQKDMEVGT